MESNKLQKLKDLQRAILYREDDTINSILRGNPNIINKKFQDGDTPIIYAIKKSRNRIY